MTSRRLRIGGLIVACLALTATTGCGQYPGVHEERARADEASGVLDLSTFMELRSFDARAETPPRNDERAPHVEGNAADRVNGRRAARR